MYANGVPRDASAVVTYSFISELLIIAFLHHDFASFFILYEMEDILAYFLITSLFIFLFKLNIDLNTFI